VGIEIMANSDNVLRGGLTPKFMAVEELIRVLTFQTGRPAIMIPEAVSPTEAVYRTPADEFELSVIQPHKSPPHRSSSRRNGEILLAFDGEVDVRSEDAAGRIRLKGGQSAFVPSATGAYRIYGNGTVYKAAIPDLTRQQKK
jgi:mannose-6-phosphate isomerase